MEQGIIEAICEIEGFISRREVEFLYSLARSNKGETIVEIGSWKGKSTVCLAKGSQAGEMAKVYAIDPHRGTLSHWHIRDTEPILRQNLARAQVEHIVIPLVMTSEEAVKGWNKPIGLLWIDGDHDYQGVKQDLKRWLPHVIPGGVICCHDFWLSLSSDWGYPGVSKAVRECLLKFGQFSKPKTCDRILCVTKEGNKILPWHSRLKWILISYGASLVSYAARLELISSLPQPLRPLCQYPCSWVTAALKALSRN